MYRPDGRIDWEKLFAGAHLTSGPKSHGLTVSKSNPSPDRGSRNLWAEDKPLILAAAEKYGYRILLNNSKVVSFIKSFATNPTL